MKAGIKVTAKELGLSENYIRRRVQTKSIPHLRTEKGKYIFDIELLNQFLNDEMMKNVRTQEESENKTGNWINSPTTQKGEKMDKNKSLVAINLTLSDYVYSKLKDEAEKEGKTLNQLIKEKIEKTTY